jgi:hypothetical protein
LDNFGWFERFNVRTMDYEVKVQLPSGMKCSGVVGNTKNVCIMRVRNNARDPWNVLDNFGWFERFNVRTSTRCVDVRRQRTCTNCPQG